MSLFDLFKKPDAEAQARSELSEARQAEVLRAIRARVHTVPNFVAERMQASREGRMPWLATLTPAELRMARSHGIRPIAAVSATCWLHYGFSWTNGHAQGWQTALQRLRDEARAAGANAVLDVKMRTIPVDVENSMDFTLVGTAVRVEGLAPSEEPIVATVPALEFVKLLEADIVPTGIAIGAEYRWITDWSGQTNNLYWVGNTECDILSDHWKHVRDRAYLRLREDAQRQGNGALAHINFSQMFEREGDKDSGKQYLARHIVIATVIDQPRSRPLMHDFHMVVDMHAGKTPLTGTKNHHQSYQSNDEEGAI
jgi:Putative heavy-metal-binding